jgi:hypothetical protein
MMSRKLSADVGIGGNSDMFKPGIPPFGNTCVCARTTPGQAISVRKQTIAVLDIYLLAFAISITTSTGIILDAASVT